MPELPALKTKNAPEVSAFSLRDSAINDNLPTPSYLEEAYWWAYVRPWAVGIFEREWLVNLILWGNYRRLGDAALAAMGDDLSGKTLQISCCYGNLSPRLANAARKCGGKFGIVDVLQVQLDNLRAKLPPAHEVDMARMDSSALNIPDAAFDRALLFFLLHEQPESVRVKTLAEAFRVVRPGGTVTIVDFAPPRLWHPLRYLWLPILSVLEPFAPDLWKNPISRWLPKKAKDSAPLLEQSIFGGMYQVLKYQV